VKFFAHESCGKCTPCREGSDWIEKVLYRVLHGLGRPEDVDLLLDFGDNIVPGLNAPFAQTTICALGPSVMSPVVGLVRWFRDELEHRIGASFDRSARSPVDLESPRSRSLHTGPRAPEVSA
jgi:NADH:ubiquinone oxidoreductase subunit F (NADH-binding)